MNPTEKVETILKLAEIGYSRLEIEQLLAEPKPEKVEMIDVLATGKPTETEPEPEKEPVQQPTPSVGTHEEGVKIANLEKSIESLTDTIKALQASNLKHADLPPQEPTETADDILASLINRNYKKGD